MSKSLSNKNILGTLTVNSKTVPTISYSDSVPVSPVAGDMWVRTSDMVVFHYYSDGSSSQWIEIKKSDDTNLGARVTAIETTYAPSGVIHQYAGASAPTGWLLCDGTAVSRTVYSALYAVLGTSYGTGDGSTTFNLPDFRGRVPVGKNSGTFATLGATGGTETVTLDVTQIPSHTHIQNAHTHVQDSHNHTQNSHNHTQDAHAHVITTSGTQLQYINTTAGLGSSMGGMAGVYNNDNLRAASTTATNQATTATNQATTATNQNTTATNQNTGGGLSHNNLQPYQVVNYIIKY